MTASADPAEIVQAVCEGVGRLVSGGLSQAERDTHIDRLAAMYAEQTDVRHPFAPGGDTPLRTRDDLRRHFAEVAAPVAEAVEHFEPADVHVHRTGDPEVVVTEFHYEGLAGGRPFSIANIFVTRVRAGLIIESRDYADHIAAARAIGQLPTLAATLAAGEAG